MTREEIEQELRANDPLRELMVAVMELKPEIRSRFVSVVCGWLASGGCGGLMDLEYRLRAAGFTLSERG